MEMERWWEVRIEEVDHLRKKDVLGSCHVFQLLLIYVYRYDGTVCFLCSYRT